MEMGKEKVMDNAVLVLQANRMAQTANKAACKTRRIAGLSSAFQLFGLGSRFVSMLVDANHGSRVLPKLLRDIVGCGAQKDARPDSAAVPF